MPRKCQLMLIEIRLIWFSFEIINFQFSLSFVFMCKVTKSFVRIKKLIIYVVIYIYIFFSKHAHIFLTVLNCNILGNEIIFKLQGLVSLYQTHLLYLWLNKPQKLTRNESSHL